MAKMKNVYHSDIVQLLLQSGSQGMRVADISKQVYNQHAGLFTTGLEYESLHQTLRCYLWRQSQLRRSPFRHLRHGIYAIKPDMAVQLDFCFDSQSLKNNEEDSPTPTEPLQTESPKQLLLFPDFL